MFTPPLEPPRRVVRFCAVCGDSPAKVHYGVLACFGCKGAVKDGRNKYVCRYERRCNVDKYERNSCRYCRFRRCLQVGMNPDAVRPDRDTTGKQRIGRLTKSQKMLLTRKKSVGRTTSNKDREDPDDWTKFLNSDYRSQERDVIFEGYSSIRCGLLTRKMYGEALLIDLIKLESDVQLSSSSSSPPHDTIEGFSLKSLLADRALHRMHPVQNTAPQSSSSPVAVDRSFTALWRLVAVVDWVDGLTRIADKDDERISFTVEDKTVLVQSSFCALTVFELVAKTAVSSTSSDLLCLYSTTPDHAKGEKLVRATLEELVNPLRALQPSEVEFTILKAIVTFNPEAAGLRPMASTRVREMRDGLQELLFKTLKKSRPKTTAGTPASNFGNYLLLLPALRHVCDEISGWLSARHPRYPSSSLSPPQPTERILIDVFNPEIDDLYASARRVDLEPRSDVETMETSPIPSTSSLAVQRPPHPPITTAHAVPQITVTEQLPSSSSFMSPLCDFSTLLIDSPYNSNSVLTPTPRPSSLSFSPKLPLQLTRSIEEILRPAGMNVDEATLWRPLQADWADKANSLNTPVFNRDVVAQFFPEANH